MGKIFPALIIPLLIFFLAGGWFWLLQELGVFEPIGMVSERPWLRSLLSWSPALSLPICVYAGAVVVWMINPARRDVGAGLVAVMATIGFGLGAWVLTNFAQLEAGPISVMELFFQSQGLRDTLPFYGSPWNQTGRSGLHLQMFWYLMIPVLSSLIGIVIGAQYLRQKPYFWKQRWRSGWIRLLVVSILAYGLFHLGPGLLGGIPFPGRFAPESARQDWAIRTFGEPSYQTVAAALKQCPKIQRQIGPVQSVSPTVGGNWVRPFTSDHLSQPEARFVLEIRGGQGRGQAMIRALRDGTEWLGTWQYQRGAKIGTEEINQNC